MEKSIAEMRSAIVEYYEKKEYSHKHAEAYVPHDADQILRIYNIIQEETTPQVPNERREPVGFFFVQKQVELDNFGQSRLTVRSALLYIYEGTTGGLGKPAVFSTFPFGRR